MALDKISLLNENTIYYLRPFRNLIINGDMNVAQRANSTNSITSTGYYTADRWALNINSLSTWTNSVETDSPLENIKKSLKVTCNSAVNSVGASSFAILQQKIEGQNLQVLKKGTQSAEIISLNFWVKSNVANTYIVELFDHNNNRAISKSYTINSTNTWEKKTISFPGDSFGSLNNDTNLSLSLNFWLSAGNNFKLGSLSTVWNSVINSDRAVGQVNLALNSTNYLQITAVQLEVGSVDSPFEIIPADIQLIRCQRYYYKNLPGIVSGVFCNGFANSTTTSEGLVRFPVKMRIIPQSLETSGNISDYQIKYLQLSASCSALPTYLSSTTNDGGYIQFTIASGLTLGYGTALRAGSTAAYLAWSAEL